jgi:hypothetical protein
MAGCPDSKCQQDQEEIKKILFKDAAGGVRWEIGRLKSTKASWTALGTVAGLLLVVFAAIYTTSYQKRSEFADIIKQNSDTVQMLSANQRALTTDIGWIKGSLRRLERSKGLAGGDEDAIPK